MYKLVIHKASLRLQKVNENNQLLKGRNRFGSEESLAYQVRTMSDSRQLPTSNVIKEKPD